MKQSAPNRTMQVRIKANIALLVKHAAAKSKRTIPAEINFQLEKSYEPESTLQFIKVESNFKK